MGQRDRGWIERWEYGDPADVVQRREAQALAAAKREREQQAEIQAKRDMQARIRAKVMGGRRG